uniref:Late blight resistance protein homolog R1B-14 n=1 Tax=Nicotiana tabacum TaxID=4097 RepID=A0A1S3ZSD9_TOBAC
YTLPDSSKKDWEQELTVLSDKIQHVKTLIYQEVRKWVRSYLPKNDGLGFSNSLLDSLKELISCHSGSVLSLKNKLEVVHEELESFQKNIAKQSNNKHDEQQHLVARVVDKAYEVEYIVDSFAVRDAPLTYLTEWFSDLVREIVLLKTKPAYLNSFDEKDSWHLLERKVFGEQICPQQLREVGQAIAKKCKGVPICIVLVAGLLAKIDKTEQCWKLVELSFGEGIQVDAKDLLKLAYNDLPDKLRPCFLYFGAFVEDREIFVSKLINLWIAGGFIENDKEKCLEDIAEDYLEDLIERELVIVTKKKSNEKLKACRLHDQVLEFCLAKAKENNFLLCLKRDYDAKPPQFYSEKPSHRRLSFCSNGDYLAGWRPSCSHARSVLFREVNDDSFSTELNHLRYLAVQTTRSSIPSSIENLYNLQTFIIKRTGGKQVHLPDILWRLINLRHISISYRALFNLHDAQESLDESPSKLYDLATLSSPYVSSAEDMEIIVRKVPNLRKLKCEFADSWGWEKNENGFPVLDSLHRLETLKVHFFNFPKVGPSRLNFPLNLKKLTLCKFYLPHAEISIMAKLVNLEILKLQQVVFEREEWEVADEEFPKLKLLKLENLELSQWRASDDAFYNLRRLVLRGCSHLEAIPYCFEDIPYLEYIEVKSCSEDVINSARDITEMRVDMGADWRYLLVADVMVIECISVLRFSIPCCTSGAMAILVLCSFYQMHINTTSSADVT